MPNISPSFNWGSEIKNLNPTLYNQLFDSYNTTARVVNTKTSVYTTTTNPPADNDINRNFIQGDIWINSSSDTAWIMTSRISANVVTWKQIT